MFSVFGSLIIEQHTVHMPGTFQSFLTVCFLSIHYVNMVKLFFMILLLVSMPFERAAQDSTHNEEAEDYDSASASASQIYGSHSLSSEISIFHRNPCSFRGNFLSHNEKLTLDPCTECSCKNGTTFCHVQSCAADPQCPSISDPAFLEVGECCPRCASNPKIEQDCDFRGRILQRKHQIRLDACTLCTCENHGRTQCHVQSCPTESGCEISEAYNHADVCCLLCPYKLIVKSVRISHDHEFTFNESNSHKVRFSLHVAVDKIRSSRTVQGENMWRLGAWMSANKNGSGIRMSFQSNIFNEENEARPFHRRNPSNFKWLGIEYTIESGEEACVKYFCVEFDQNDDPSPRYDGTFTFQPLDNERWRLVDCLPFSYCNDLMPELHSDLTIKRIFERKLGDAIIFECNVTHAHTIWWKHSSWAKTERVSSSNTFRIDNISLEDQGSYCCLARGNGQYLMSAQQILVIPGMAQFLLRIDANKSSLDPLQEMSQIQTYIVSELEEAHILAIPLNTGIEANRTIYVSKQLKSGQDLNNIEEEVLNILQQAKQSTALNNVSDVAVQLQGLSLCFKDFVVTEVGNLSFSSVRINSEKVSNELCVVPSTLPRGSRRCKGDLVTAAIWADIKLPNCFRSSTKVETRRLIDSFFEIMGKQSVTMKNVSYISRDLVDITTARTTEKGEFAKISSVLDQVSSARSTSPMVTSNMLQTVDNIMDAAIAVAYEDGLMPITASSRILQSVELQLNNIQRSGKNFSLSLPNIGVKVVQILDLNDPISFTVCLSSDRKDERVSRDTFNIPVYELSLDCSNGVSIYIPTVVMNLPINELNQRMLPVTFATYQSGVLFNDEASRKDNKRLDSIIISASTSYKVDNLPKGSFIRTWFSPLSVNNSKHTCVFWNKTLYEESGGWSSEGCHYEETNDSYAHICKCDHLATVAVLLDLTNDTKNSVSDAIVFTGCIIAIISLFATICTFVVIKDLRNKMPHQLALNLCIALFGLYCCFLLGMTRTAQTPSCVIFGGMTHFFVVSSVAWMSVDATVMYFHEMDIVSAHSGYIMVASLMVAWGLPFILVLLNVAIATESYLNGYYCLPLFSSAVFFISILGIISLLLIYNVIVYILVVWKLKYISNDTGQSTYGKVVLPRLQTSVSIFALFVLSWLFGFLNVGNSSITYSTLFCLSSLLLGLCIFLQYCLRQEEVHRTLRRVFKITETESNRDGFEPLELHH